MQKDSEILIKILDLPETKSSKIATVLNTVTLYRLNPYISIVRDNDDLFNNLKASNNGIKDKWDAIIELYRYNMRLSISLYPHISILENVLKAKIDSCLTKKYGDNWCFEYDLIFKKLEFTDLDKKLYYKFHNQSINKDIRNRIYKIYERKNPTLTKSKIKSKIQKIKYCCSIITEAKEYQKSRGKTAKQVDFVETRPTFNYWLDILSIEKLFLNDEGEIDIRDIFESLSLLKYDPSEGALKHISKKLDDIRNLRNYISHHRQIIGNKAIENRSLLQIYNNIIEILNVLGCEDVEWMIGDLQCQPNDAGCIGNTFDVLYKKYEFIHDIEIKAKGIKEFTTA